MDAKRTHYWFYKLLLSGQGGSFQKRQASANTSIQAAFNAIAKADYQIGWCPIPSTQFAQHCKPELINMQT